MLLSEFSFEVPHHYLLDRFGLEVRLTLNKTPLVNRRPQLEVDVILGDTILNVHQHQIIRSLKLIEYIGCYNQFQQGALTRFLKRPLKQEVADAYIKGYCEWQMMTDDKKADKGVLQNLRQEMKAIEDGYPAEKIIVLRRFASKLIT